MIHCIVCNAEADYVVSGYSFCVDHAGVRWGGSVVQLKERKLEEFKDKLARK